MPSVRVSDSFVPKQETEQSGQNAYNTTSQNAQSKNESFSRFDRVIRSLHASVLPEDSNSIKIQLLAFIQSKLLLQATQSRDEWIIRCARFQGLNLGPQGFCASHVHEAALHDGR